MKKTNKENPLVTFRKMNEARNKTVGKSLRKAQDGLESNGDAMDMINKPGSTGGYKSTPTWSSAAKMLAGASSNLNSGPKPNNIELDNLIKKNNVPRPVLGTAGDMDMYERYSSKPKSNTPMSDSIYPPPEKLLGMSAEQMRERGIIKKTGGTHKMPNGKVMLNSKMKMGGTTKAKKFAALAPPYNKATFADRIVGAKKNAKKK